MTPIENPAFNIVCVVNDDPAVLISIGRLFASDGLPSEPSISRRSFSRTLKHIRRRSSFLDIWMEGVNGLEVQAQLSAISQRTRGFEIATPNKDAPNQTNSYYRTLRLSRG